MPKLPYEIDGPYRAEEQRSTFAQVMGAISNGLLLAAGFAGGVWWALYRYAC